MEVQMIIQENVRLEQIKAFKPKTIFYGANTCWWTHDPDHLRVNGRFGPPPEREPSIVPYKNAEHPDPRGGVMRGRTVNPGSIPTDPVGGVLFQTDDIDGFIKSAEENFTHYGKHGIRAFMAAHHSNCFVAPLDRSNLPAIYVMPHFASPDWADYNAALDRLDGKGL
mgnify:CR=1 FL=1